MSSSSAKDRLQPSLFDRIADEFASELATFEEVWGALDGLLDVPQRTAVKELLLVMELDEVVPTSPGEGVLATLNKQAQSLLDRVLNLERLRRSGLRRVVALSGRQLRDAVLRDLQILLNTAAIESRQHGTLESLSRWPVAQSSVLNYGIPALAGGVRNCENLAEFAEQVELAIERYEPRLRRVRVTLGEAAVSSPAALTNPVYLVIEGELWGNPVSEHLVMRTILDLDTGRVEVAGEGQAA